MESRGKSSEISQSMEKFDIKIERPKPSVLEEVINVLKTLLEYCLCCLSCGCYPGPRQSGNGNGDEYGTVLLDSEKLAVQNLLRYLENELVEEPVLSEEHVRALSILTYSDNTDLQRSAALCFTEVSERMKSPLTIAMARPLVELLRSRDIQVQKAATLAVSNFTLLGPDANKDAIVTCGGLDTLIRLLDSPNVDVQCNTCGCITTLAASDAYKQLIITGNGVKPLIHLLRSEDGRVQRNAAGAVLNMTHLQANRNELVARGAIPVLVEILHSSDPDIQYYSAAALSNIAVNSKHRAMMVAVGHYDVIKQMVKLLSVRTDRVKCQACFALRNLASDGENQVAIVKYGALPKLRKCLHSAVKDTLTAAVACLRNLSIHKGNEAVILSEGMLDDLCAILGDGSNSEAQRHSAGTLRNLAVGTYIRVLVEAEVVEAMAAVVLDLETKMAVLAEATAALAVLADEDDAKYKLVELHDGKVFYKLVSLASLSSHSEVQYNSAGTLGQLALIELPTTLKTSNKQGILLYIDMFLKSPDPNFNHIALWTLVQFLKDEIFLQAFQEHGIEHVITRLLQGGQPPTILELAASVLRQLKGEEEETSSDD